MGTANTINLNGTDYEVEDREARSSQAALDDRVDNLGTLIEQQVEPLAQQADDLQAEVDAQGLRITALENAPSGLRFTEIYSGIDGHSGTTLTVTGANKGTIGLLFRFRENATGFFQDFFMPTRLSTATQSEDSALISSAGHLSGTSGAFIYMARQMNITTGGTSYANWKVVINFGIRQAFNTTTTTNDDSVMRISSVWRVDQGD